MILEEIGHIIDCVAGLVPYDESVRRGMKQNEDYVILPLPWMAIQAS